MSAERTPRRNDNPAKAHSSEQHNWINLFLQPAICFVLRHPFFTILIALLLAGAGTWGTLNHLSFKTSRLDLINPKSEFNQLWLNYIASFGAEDDVVVVVEGKNEAEIIQAVNSLADSISQRSDLFYKLFYKADTAALKKKGLHFTDENRLKDLSAFLDEAAALGQAKQQDVLDRLWDCWRIQLAPASSNIPADYQQRSLEGFDRLSKSLEAALGKEYTYVSPLHGLGEGLDLAELANVPEAEYLWAKKGSMALVLLKFKSKDESAFAQNTGPVTTLREILDAKRKEFPGLTLGLTGLPIMENDEMNSSQNAMNLSTIISLAAVGILFLFAFRGLRYSFLLMITLLIGIAWTMGFVSFGIGHLNILSIAFSAILVGLGVDFGIHYLARYSACRKEGRSVPGALVRSSREVGPGIFVGALTTAVAFAAAGGQEFIGVAELGQIAGAGVLLCCIAFLIVLPVETLFSDKILHRATAEGDTFRIKMASITDVFSRNFWATLIVSVGAAALSFMFMSDLEYDHNLMNLQPKGLESVEWEKRLMNESDQNVWFALSLSKDPAEILRRKDEFLKQPNIIRVEEIVSLLPKTSPEKQGVINKINQTSSALLENLARAQGQIRNKPAAPSAGDLNAFLTAIEHCPDALKKYDKFGSRISELRRRFNLLKPEEINRRLHLFETQMSQQYCNLIQLIYSVSDPNAPQMEDLPSGWAQRMYSPDGYYAMRIYGSGDIWCMENLKQFVDQVRAVDAKATGNPLQTYECSLQMKSSYETAAWYALAGIMIILFLDFKSLRHTLLAMIPLVLGIMFLFGMMGFMQISLNSANMIILPLIIGIGIDDGVHIVHDFRRRNKNKPFRISNSTAGALTMTSLTSILGFSSLMTADHRGLQSLGMVLTMGVACCMFTSLSILPALLTRMSKWEIKRMERRNAKSKAAEEQPTEPKNDFRQNPQNDFIPLPGNEPIPLWKLEAYYNQNHPNIADSSRSGAA